MDSTHTASAPSTSSASPSVIVYSIFELIHIIYISGLSSITGWEVMLSNLKKIILDEPDSLVNLFFILSNAVSNFYFDEASQPEYYRLKDATLTFEQLIQLFQEQITDEHLHIKRIGYDIMKRFKDLVEKSKIEVLIPPSAPKSDIDIVNLSSENDDDDDDIEKAFSTVFASNKSCNNIKFEQSFHLLNNDEKQWLKTSGEEGRYLIDIKITDTHDIRKVPADQWWKKVHKRAVFLASSSQDELYVNTNKILKHAFNKINKIKDKTKGKYAVDRFKPY